MDVFSAEISASRRSRRDLTLAIGVALSAAITVLQLYPPTLTIALILILMWSGLVWRLCVAHPTFAAIPGAIVSGTLMMVAVGGYLVWGRLQTEIWASGVAPLNQKTRGTSLALMMMSSVAVLIGVVLTCACIGRSPSARGGGTRTLAFSKHRRILYAVSIGAIAVCIVAMGPDSILRRAGYLDYPDGNQLLLKGAGLLIILGATSAAALTASTQVLARIFGWSMLGLNTALIISQGSRRLALLPLVFLLGRLLAGRRPTRIGGALAVALSLYLLQLPLVFRSLREHGLLPHVASLSRVLSAHAPWETILSNLLFGFPLTSQVATIEPPITPAAFWVSIDPRLGNSTQWPRISESLRVNKFVPYSSLGELANHGRAVLVAFSLVMGIVITVCAIAVSKSGLIRPNGTPVMELVMMGSCGLVALSFTQYNLRSSMRMIYFIVLITGLNYLYRRFGRRRSLQKAELR